MATPLGVGREITWQRLLQGDRAGRELTQGDIDYFEQLSQLLKRCPAGAPLQHHKVEAAVGSCNGLFETLADGNSFLDGLGQDHLNRIIAVCLNEALSDCDLHTRQLPSTRTGCVIGTSKSSLRALERHSINRGRNPTTSGFFPQSPLETVQQLTSAKGPGSCPVAACASGLYSIIEAASLIESGLCDVCIAGSADASLRASVMSSFHRLGVTSRNADPASACRPFDERRDGFIIGEGGCVVILESRAFAEQRKANIYGQVIAGRWLNDPTGMTQIDDTGEIVGALLRQLDCEVSFASVHGTGTETNDLAEARGMASCFDGRLPSFGVKGAIGHLLGAAASVEFGLACLALRDGKIPGTTNLQEHDSRCQIGLSPTSQSVRGKTALKLSLGFGGHVAACVVEKS